MIHPSSVVSESAEIDQSTKVGPFCVIGENVKIGRNNNLISHVSIVGNTIIGENNTFYPYSSIGSEPQDLKFKNEKTFLEIGNNNKFRENVTINPGTKGGGFKTQIKNNCLFMVGSHIAHDCKISSNVILANNATLAGHVEIDENAILGGNSAVHQFVRIGKFAMVGGMSGVEKDIIPYGLYLGIRENLKGINLIGLKRKGLSSSYINNIHRNIKNIFNSKDTIINNINKIEKESKTVPEIKEIIDFIKSNPKRGLCTLNND